MVLVMVRGSRRPWLAVVKPPPPPHPPPLTYLTMVICNASTSTELNERLEGARARQSPTCIAAATTLPACAPSSSSLMISLSCNLGGCVVRRNSDADVWRHGRRVCDLVPLALELNIDFTRMLSLG